ncbi:BRO-N domain-containing protein [Azotobacter beijerinckii]|uniref:BRO family, N-terminal domain n=1 Tax=Azotobacter beijerinckii TaxID=170623 RepID=A0A1I1B776_9GAMM|nr:Bro-N domain-containing protein [Azotobacter beijerinckii]SFB46111.1 BRO family, N-terminal domain [Azotobacter beijerinckii]
MSQSHPTQNPSAFPALVFRDVEFDVVDRNGRPWLRLPQIGVALGYANPYKVQQVYDRNADEFTDAMTGVVKLTTPGGKQDVRIFSLRGAHLIGMLAKTKPSKGFRRWVLDVLDGMTDTPPEPHDPAPTPFSSPAVPEFIALRYNGHPLRVTRMAGGFWYGSHGLARALGYLTNAKINFGLRGEAQLRVVPHRGKTLAVINHVAMLEVVGRAPAQVAQPFMRWLSVVLPGRFGDAAPTLPASVDPLARVTGDSKQLAFDYFAQCRQAVTHAGGSVPAWDSGAEQRIADDMAALLVSNRRWLLAFADGVPVLKAVQDNTVLLNIDDTEHLARLLREQVPAAALPDLVDTACRRLAGLAEDRR